MTGISPTCTLVLTSSFEVLLWIGAALVWLAVSHTRAAGPCRLAVGLLVGAQLCSSAGSVAGAHPVAADWTWLLQTIFYFTFLYLLYHMAVLLSVCRR